MPVGTKKTEYTEQKKTEYTEQQLCFCTFSWLFILMNFVSLHVPVTSAWHFQSVFLPVSALTPVHSPPSLCFTQQQNQKENHK